MAIVIDRVTKHIDTHDTVDALAHPERWLTYHKRTPPQDVYDAPPHYRVIDGENVRVATASERAQIDAAMDAQREADARAARNGGLQRAAAMCGEISTTADPSLLVLLGVVLEIVDEFRDLKKGNPKPSRELPELAAAVAGRLLAMRT